MEAAKSKDTFHLLFKNGTAYLVHDPNRFVISVVGASFLVLIFAVAFALNTILVFTIGSSQTLRRLPLNIFLLNLSLCCVLECLLNISMSIIYLINQDWEFGQETCNVNASCMQLVMVTTTFAFVAFVTDRTLAVKNAVKYNQNLKNSYPKLVVAFLWICGIALTFAPAAFLFDAKPFSSKYSCAVIGVKSWEYAVIVLVIGFSVPWLVLLVDLFIIGQFIYDERSKMQRQQRALRNRVNSSDFLFTSAQIWNERDNLMLLALLLGLYVVLLVPHILTMQIHQMIFSGVTESKDSVVSATTSPGTRTGSDSSESSSTDKDSSYLLDEFDAGAYDEAFIWLRYLYSMCVPLVILRVNKDIRKKCAITFCCCKTNSISVSSPPPFTAISPKTILEEERKKSSKKKKQKYKKVAPFTTPVLFSTSEGLHLRVIDDHFSGFTDYRDLLDQSLGKSQWSVEPKFVCEYCDVPLQMDDLTNLKETPHFGEARSNEEDVYMTDDVEGTDATSSGGEGNNDEDDRDVQIGQQYLNYDRRNVDSAPIARRRRSVDKTKKQKKRSNSANANEQQQQVKPKGREAGRGRAGRNADGNKKNVRFSHTVSEIPRQWLNNNNNDGGSESLAESGVWSEADSVMEEDSRDVSLNLNRILKDSLEQDANSFLDSHQMVQPLSACLERLNEQRKFQAVPETEMVPIRRTLKNH